MIKLKILNFAQPCVVGGCMRHESRVEAAKCGFEAYDVGGSVIIVKDGSAIQRIGYGGLLVSVEAEGKLTVRNWMDADLDTWPEADNVRKLKPETKAPKAKSKPKSKPKPRIANAPKRTVKTPPKSGWVQPKNRGPGPEAA